MTRRPRPPICFGPSLVRTVPTSFAYPAKPGPQPYEKYYGGRKPSPGAAPAPAAVPQRPKTPRKKKTVAETKAAVRAVIVLMQGGRTEGEAVREVAPEYGYKPETLERNYRRLHRIVRADMRREQRLSASKATAQGLSANKESASEKLSADKAPATPRLSARTKKSGPGRTEKT
jgi:hypothetical protein